MNVNEIENWVKDQATQLLQATSNKIYDIEEVRAYREKIKYSQTLPYLADKLVQET